MANKMTKKEMFAMAIAMVEGKEVAVSATEFIDFFNHEIELLEKKGSGSSKPTKVQIENEGYKQAMLDTMAELDRPVTISELMEVCEGINGLKNQRVSALMTQLKNANLVTRTEDKKKAYFSISEGVDEE